MGIAALLYLSEVDIHGLYLGIYLAVVYVHHLEFLAATYHRDVAVLEIHHLVGVFNQRTCIGTDEEFILAYSHHEWRLLACSHYLVGIVAVEHCNGVGSNHFVQGQLHGSKQVGGFLLSNIFYELHKHLGVGVADKLHSLSQQLGLEVGIVLDDTVVNNGEIFRHGIVGMGIERRRLSMSGPTRVGYTHRAAYVLVFAVSDQIIYLSFRLVNIKTTVVVDQSDSSTVISSIFKPAQSFDKNRKGFFLSYISYYSTHKICI